MMMMMMVVAVGGLRPDEGTREVPRSRLMHLVKHELARDSSLWAVELAGSPLERRHVLLHHLVEEHGGELGVQQRAELEGNLPDMETITHTRYMISHFLCFLG